MSADPQLQFVLGGLRPQPVEWCCSHLGWVFPPQLPQSRKSLTNMPRAGLLGDSRLYQLDRQ